MIELESAMAAVATATNARVASRAIRFMAATQSRAPRLRNWSAAHALGGPAHLRRAVVAPVAALGHADLHRLDSGDAIARDATREVRPQHGPLAMCAPDDLALVGEPVPVLLDRPVRRVRPGGLHRAPHVPLGAAMPDPAEGDGLQQAVLHLRHRLAVLARLAAVGAVERLRLG